MHSIESSQLRRVSGGVMQTPGLDGQVKPVGLFSFEVGATRMGDNLSYTGSSGGNSSGGYSPGECSTLGTMAGVATGLVVGGVCSTVAGAVTGGMAVPICATLGSVTGLAVSTAVVNSCNGRAGR